ncbi:5-hydroxytryptamine receptor 1D-like [Antedon mediterranea]|uniref:5-hydroxytryptamine receptor 1D-like n=1 Tax=Antedon mediterranea TaxID=105859 RepID=UPI003AF7CF8C
MNFSIGDIFAWLMVIITVCGNIIVIVSWLVEKKINSKPSSILILNLSVADLLVGFIHRKSFITLVTLMSAFCICWLPFNIAIIVYTSCGWWNRKFLNYLLWSNSMVNPFVYAATSPHFREFFVNAICRSKHRTTRVQAIC